MCHEMIENANNLHFLSFLDIEMHGVGSGNLSLCKTRICLLCIVIIRDNFVYAPSRGSRNGRPIVRNAILALSDKWLSLDTRPMDEQIIIAQMSFINLGQVHIWFWTSADAMLLVRRTSVSQISRQPLPSQWETTLQCNIVYHWLGTCSEWPLIIIAGDILMTCGMWKCYDQQ